MVVLKANHLQFEGKLEIVNGVKKLTFKNADALNYLDGRNPIVPIEQEKPNGKYVKSFELNNKSIIGASSKASIKDGETVVLRFPNGHFYEVKIDSVDGERKLCIPIEHKNSELTRSIRLSNGNYELYTKEAHGMLSEGKSEIKLLDAVQLILDCAGFIPAFGAIADGLSLVLATTRYVVTESVDFIFDILVNVIALAGDVIGNVAKTVLKEVYYATKLVADSKAVRTILDSGVKIVDFLDSLKDVGSNFISLLTGPLDGASAHLEGTWLKGAASIFRDVSSKIKAVGSQLMNKVKGIIETVRKKLLNVVEGTSNLNFKVLKESPADEVNDWWLKEMNYTEPPYKPGTLVQEIELTENTTFVRVFDGVNSGQAGGWIMKAEDIAGLTPAQIQAKFALPNLPNQVTDVVLEAGTKIRTGVVNPLFGHQGGGIQFDLMGQRVGEFINARPLN